ncbi:MAG: EpsI family protein [Planctomycetaceae bacterium]|jgi:hypothetical protein|nr:EpsI family protein [Planctomycetaceae bacterium]
MSKSSQLIIGIVVIIFTTFCMTVYSGMQTGRWSPFKGLLEARAVLRDLPKEINGWDAVGEDQTLDNDTITMLQIQDGYIARSYRNSTTQAVVHLVLMVGPTGRVVVHTPEICFGGKDYQKEDNRVSVTIPVVLQDKPTESDDTFWRVDFVNRGLKRDKISFYYSVSLGKSWIATENPRSAFQYSRYAYKIQIQSLSDGEEDNVKKFLQDCLPTIHEFLRETL